MNLNRALSDIAEIRAQIDRAESYRGFRSMTVGLSGLLVIAGGCLQNYWIEHPEQQPLLFLKIWVVIAMLSAAGCTLEMVIRNRISGDALLGKLHRSLICRTIPSILVGLVVTFAVINTDGALAEIVRWLPGLWAMLYGLGLWACGAALPRVANIATAYFLIGGALTLVLSSSGSIGLGSQMVFLFATGQLLLALSLFWKFERTTNDREAA